MKTIFDFITTEETAFKTNYVEICDGYPWNMWEHLNLSILYKNSKFKTGNSDDKPFKNILRPLLNLQYRATGFDVKDIVLFVNDAYQYFKSFLVKKFHEKWARENAIDTFIDEMVESYVDFGGALVKNIGGVKPEVVPLQRIAFCDQTDILSGPICEKHFYSVEQLKEMEAKGWERIDEVITLSEATKQEPTTTIQKTATPSKYIEIYELHGSLPRAWLQDEYSKGEEENDFVRQLQIITFYKDRNGAKQGIRLFRGKESKQIYKLVIRDKIYGRALGMGGAEELFEPQVWINYDAIRIKQLLDAASKVILQTSDEKYATRNKLSGMENLEVTVTQDGKKIEQINTQPVNLPLFERAMAQWETHARLTSAATESILGEAPTAGTPFKLQELVTAESHSLHEYRKGKLATFLDEVYRDWIIPHIAREITKGQKFLAQLDLDELQTVADSIMNNATNNMVKERILNGQLIYPEEIETYKQQVRDQFMRKGNKHFIEILKDELKDAPMSVEVNIVGKQKNLSAITDKLVNIFRQIIANPTILQTPQGAKLFNTILESSGLSPIDFSGFTVPQPQVPSEGQIPAPRKVATTPIEKLVGATV